MNNNITWDVKEFIGDKYWEESFDSIKILWDNENLVFSLKEKVFRITNFNHRNENEISSEVKLLKQLYINWASVVEVLPSSLWNFYEKNDEENYFITTFRKASWKIIDVQWHENSELIITEWWRTMWEIHKIISNNSTILDSSNRLDWDEEIIIDKAEYLLPNEDSFILDILNKIMNSFNALDKNNNEYWLVHTDMRPRNFHYDNSKITHFDFDDISNNWFIYDIAVSTFHEIEQYETENERTIFMENFLNKFIGWYLKEKEIKWIYLEYFIDFMKIRLIYAYIDYYKRLKIKWIDSWKEKMLIRRKFIEDFSKFIDIEKIEKVLYSLNLW